MPATPLDWNAAVLSLVVPGWGQLERRRSHAGRVFLAWAGLTVLLVTYAPVLGVPSGLVWLELGVLTVWSAADALLTRRAPAP